MGLVTRCEYSCCFRFRKFLVRSEKTDSFVPNAVTEKRTGRKHRGIAAVAACKPGFNVDREIDQISGGLDSPRFIAMR